MTSQLLLDTHVLFWASAEPERLSAKATSAISEASELAVAGISWWELAWLASHHRITLTTPIRTWLSKLESAVTTLPLTAAIAETATNLSNEFPNDPADRIIYATAIEHGIRLVTKDAMLRGYRAARQVTIW